MVNKVATDYWIYGEYGDSFGKPLNAFLHQGRGMTYTVYKKQVSQKI